MGAFYNWKSSLYRTLDYKPVVLILKLVCNCLSMDFCFFVKMFRRKAWGRQLLCATFQKSGWTGLLFVAFQRRSRM